MEARTASSIISLDPYNNPLEIHGGISIGILLTSLSDLSCFLDHLQSICDSQGSKFQVYCLDWSSYLVSVAKCPSSFSTPPTLAAAGSWDPHLGRVELLTGLPWWLSW